MGICNENSCKQVGKISSDAHWEHALYPTLESEPMTKSKFCQHYSSQWVHFYQDYSKLNEIEHF